MVVIVYWISLYVCRYFTRFDEELEQIDIENSLIKTRKGRVHASREDSIKITIGNERRDYESCGLGKERVYRGWWHLD